MEVETFNCKILFGNWGDFRFLHNVFSFSNHSESFFLKYYFFLLVRNMWASENVFMNVSDWIVIFSTTSLSNHSKELHVLYPYIGTVVCINVIFLHQINGPCSKSTEGIPEQFVNSVADFEQVYVDWAAIQLRHMHQIDIFHIFNYFSFKRLY